MPLTIFPWMPTSPPSPIRVLSIRKRNDQAVIYMELLEKKNEKDFPIKGRCNSINTG